MILYRPTDGDVEDKPIILRPRTCFLMTKLGEPIPEEIAIIREDLGRVLNEFGYECIDANSQTTGKDFLMKIWHMAMSVPVGIAIIDDTITHQTMANIFYEMGWMQACGKATLVIKTKNAQIPSDFIRTEYIEFGKGFTGKLKNFFKSLNEQADFYSLMSEQVERNPLLCIDYLKRAFLITGDVQYAEKSRELIASADLKDRALNSVENLHWAFATRDKIVKRSAVG